MFVSCARHNPVDIQVAALLVQSVRKASAAARRNGMLHTGVKLRTRLLALCVTAAHIHPQEEHTQTNQGHTDGYRMYDSRYMVLCPFLCGLGLVLGVQKNTWQSVAP